VDETMCEKQSDTPYFRTEQEDARHEISPGHEQPDCDGPSCPYWPGFAAGCHELGCKLWRDHLYLEVD